MPQTAGDRPQALLAPDNAAACSLQQGNLQGVGQQAQAMLASSSPAATTAAAVTVAAAQPDIDEEDDYDDL